MKTLLAIISGILICIEVYPQANCNPATSGADLDIGNVRTKIWIDGDMWWDLSGTAMYEIPKGSGKSSLFAGALWIGGKDNGGNIRIAAQTYRQSGSDFWPGAIDTSSGTVTAAQCLYYDRHWTITRQEVATFINGGAATPTITSWPGNGVNAYNEANFLAPFYDRSGDGIYDITDGDYPKYEFGIQSGDPNVLHGDQTIWWVFNDVGNVHGETNSIGSTGVEIQAQAYAFCTNDTDLSNTTFYTYKIINRSANTLYDSYIGSWVDVDLGNYLDDFVGCDVGRNMGYAYNGDNNDEGVRGYGTVIPAVGIDLLEGPLADANDGIDNDRDSIVDEQGEQIAVSGFMYYNNDFTVTGNPTSTFGYYNYMKCIWKDGVPLTYGGTGYNPASTDTCFFMFPDNSDPSHFGTKGIDYGFNWSEKLPTVNGVSNNPSDRRFLMGTGKFTMLPGQVNFITKAAVWARVNGGPDSSLQALKITDDRIQSFFDSNFNNIPTCNIGIGIEEVDHLKLVVYPNPAIESVRFICDGDARINIYSADGKLVYESQDPSHPVSLINWAPGSYLYKVTDRNGKHNEGKLTVLHQ